jgi:hypothetical protein
MVYGRFHDADLGLFFIWRLDSINEFELHHTSTSWLINLRVIGIYVTQ